MSPINLINEPTDIVKNSKLGIYCVEHPENLLLNNIITEIQKKYNIRNGNVLFYCYESIINENLLDIINEIVIGDNSDDELEISFVAVLRNRFDVFMMLILFLKNSISI